MFSKQGIYINRKSILESVNHFIASFVWSGTQMTHLLAQNSLNKHYLHVKMNKIILWHAVKQPLKKNTHC